jgi:hypothetical protein
VFGGEILRNDHTKMAGMSKRMMAAAPFDTTTLPHHSGHLADVAGNRMKCRCCATAKCGGG